MKKTYAEFVKAWGFTPERGGIVYKKTAFKPDPRVILPCFCDEETCEGWALVRPEPNEIAEHFELYGPYKETT